MKYVNTNVRVTLYCDRDRIGRLFAYIFLTRIFRLILPCHYLYIFLNIYHSLDFLRQEDKGQP